MNVLGSPWVPRGARAWILTCASLGMALLIFGLGYCMVYPVRWDGAGKVGAIALHFPFHLLAGSFVGSILTGIAWHGRARGAAVVFFLVVLATAGLAFAPNFRMYGLAVKFYEHVSLKEYLTNGFHVNIGQPRLELSATYGVVKDGTRLELDVWSTGQPKTGPLRPAVVMVHGGAWNHGNRSRTPDWNRWLNELGFEVFDVEYRMPPPERWLDEVGDVKAALAWVAAHAADYHVDPERIHVMGGSAGGNLSLLAAYTVHDARLAPSNDAPPVKVRTVVNLYGPTDMTLLYRTSRSPDYVRSMLRQYMGGTPDDVPERYALLSPLTHVSRESPPTLTILGASDRLVSVEHAELLDKALTRAGVPHETYYLPWNNHGFDVNWGGFGTQFARAKVRAFLARHAP